MHYRFKNLYSGIAIFLFLFLSIACYPSKKTYSNGEKWIPEDFNPAKHTLLIQKYKSNEKQQAKMEQYMQQKYPYKYEFVSMETIIDREGIYADTNIYRYALRFIPQSTTSQVFDFYFYDRATDFKYPASNLTSFYIFNSFQAVIKTILKKYQ